MSKHHKAAGWTGTTITKARANIRAQLPLPCTECGNPVHDTQPWDVGHVIPLALGGLSSMYGAAHRSCNRSSGGKLAAAQTNHKKKQTRQW